MTAPNAMLEALTDLIGASNVISESKDIAPYAEEWRRLYSKQPSLVLTPTSVEAVQKVMAWANENSVSVIPQGGNTGLVGGQVPLDGGEVILSVKKLKAVRDVDPASNVMIVEAGATVLEAQEIAQKQNRLFPLSLGSEGTCQIGGILSTNAGGTAVLAYGNSRDLCLGVEAVLADGRLYNGLSKLRKDNTGYDLKDLLVGAEGTLGIITAASLKLFPRPTTFETALLNIKDPQAGVEVLEMVRRKSGNKVTSFELLPTLGIDLQLKHGLAARDPRASDSPWHVLIEFSLFDGEEPGALLVMLEALFEAELISDASVCSSLADRKMMWLMREHFAECQTREAEGIKHDISVPVKDIPELVKRCDLVAEKVIPGIRSFAFGHMGDGNIHYDFLAPLNMPKGNLRAHAAALHEAMYEIVDDLGGSISAEHGIGQMKAALLQQKKDPVALEMMYAIKQALDPKGILNPGKVLVRRN
ncbi:FAD-binding oxidoreductase [Maritalea porphyrae]|uniref:FAD-binding oxidoreductase n=1 Tax=Maritalea porphyrae TaxID=880732 RepID=UPI0022B07610|nr:FAD-binding oxidoreductase [Maritalea porphyrae]MCZ4271324.1 FAD-binding oxidoreductase [Maritalea porphyrae]